MATVADSGSEKSRVVAKYRRSSSDTGSPEVQVALLTHHIESLSKHSANHPNDVSSNRGMLALVSQRKRLLSYLKTEDVERYKSLIAALGLRK
ncbi:MAG: 30S ribosomal protein S15 [Oligoflexia bacterium]|nr:30S ribosomal protein S15 [Oligoflexia bacterium]